MQEATKLNSAQAKAVQYTTGPLLIVAGAGTGKTTVITEKIAYLVKEKQIKTDEILALTFTDKSAGEMEERVDKLLPYGYTDLWIMTFHAFCERILKQHGLDIGLPTDFKLLNTTEQWLLVRQNLDKFDLDYYRPLGNPTKFIHELIRHFSKCKDEEISPQNYLEYAEKIKINQDNMESTGGKSKNQQDNKLTSSQDSSEISRLEEISNAYHIYQQLLLDNNSLDFGDLINYTLKLFRERPNILKKYQEQFKHILIDEFQDTNWAQYELVKLLLNPEQNLTVVGDDDQSIYKFRGASISNILQFKTDFPKSIEITLNENYRSTQNILDLAHNFIKLNNPERLETKLKLSKKLKSNLSEPGIIEHLHFETAQDEVAGIVNKIIELYNKKSNPNSKFQIPNSNFNDFAILIRANNQAEPFSNALRQNGIPFNFVASKGLYNKEIILDILAYLKLLDNYHEPLALWRILNLPMSDIKTEDLMQITNYARRKSLSLFEACEQINLLKNIEPRTQKIITRTLELIKKHTQLTKSKSTKNIVFEFLNDFNYKKYLLDTNRDNDFIYINQLINKINEFENSFDDKSVKNFINLFNLELESGESGSLSKELQEGPESVKIMTIHSAKGLEFKYVFIVNLVDKRFPSINRSDAIDLPDELVKEKIPEGDIHLQEERRLFYVALTRAKTHLYLTSAGNYGGARKKKLSRFLFETGFDKQLTINSQQLTTESQNLKNIDKKLPVTSYQLPVTFSFSQLKAYETCPYQYYLSFILKIPVTGKAVFSYGKTMHATLQKFFDLIKQNSNINQGELFTKKNKKSETQLPLLKKLLEFYEESWQDDWYEDKKQKEEYKKQGYESLKKYYEQIKNNPPHVSELEKDFSLKLDKYTIKGRIDRVDLVQSNSQNSQIIRNDSRIEIIDYKTGSAKSAKDIEKDQLLIYQMAGQEVFNWQLEKLTFYYLDNNSAISFLGTPQEIDKHKEKMLGLIEKINSQDFTADPSQFKCKYCDFKEICSHKIN